MFVQLDMFNNAGLANWKRRIKKYYYRSNNCLISTGTQYYIKTNVATSWLYRALSYGHEKIELIIRQKVLFLADL
jgi:hypothetical protein